MNKSITFPKVPKSKPRAILSARRMPKRESYKHYRATKMLSIFSSQEIQRDY